MAGKFSYVAQGTLPRCNPGGAFTSLWSQDLICSYTRNNVIYLGTKPRIVLDDRGTPTEADDYTGYGPWQETLVHDYTGVAVVTSPPVLLPAVSSTTFNGAPAYEYDIILMAWVIQHTAGPNAGRYEVFSKMRDYTGAWGSPESLALSTTTGIYKNPQLIRARQGFTSLTVRAPWIGFWGRSSNATPYQIWVASRTNDFDHALTWSAVTQASISSNITDDLQENWAFLSREPATYSGSQTPYTWTGTTGAIEVQYSRKGFSSPTYPSVPGGEPNPAYYYPAYRTYNGSWMALEKCLHWSTNNAWGYVPNAKIIGPGVYQWVTQSGRTASHQRMEDPYLQATYHTTIDQTSVSYWSNNHVWLSTAYAYRWYIPGIYPDNPLQSIVTFYETTAGNVEYASNTNRVLDLDSGRVPLSTDAFAAGAASRPCAYHGFYYPDGVDTYMDNRVSCVFNANGYVVQWSGPWATPADVIDGVYSGQTPIYKIAEVESTDHDIEYKLRFYNSADEEVAPYLITDPYIIGLFGSFSKLRPQYTLFSFENAADSAISSVTISGLISAGYGTLSFALGAAGETRADALGKVYTSTLNVTITGKHYVWLRWAPPVTPASGSMNIWLQFLGE